MNLSSGEKNSFEAQQKFHNTHESFTDKAYEDPTLLPDRYVLILTNLCNLRCSFCFQKKDPRKNAMTTEDWIKLAKQLPSYSRVTLTGGEPLAFPGFKEIFSYIASRFDCNIISNGLLLTKEKIDFLLSFPKFKVLSISIDNVGNTIRDVSPEKWKHLENMLEYFRKKRNEINPDCILDVKSVVLDETADDLLNMYKYFVEDMKVDTHAFQFLKGSPIQHADVMVEYDEILKESHGRTYQKFDKIKEQLELVRQYNLEKGKISFLHPKVASLHSESPIPNIDYVNNVKHLGERYLPCKFPWSSVHINVDGELFPCLAVSMGNIKNTSLQDIMHSEIFERFKEQIKKEGTVGACNGCGWLRPRPHDNI